MKRNSKTVNPIRKFTGKKVLLAEDNLMSAIYAETILAHLGVTLEMARNGDEAVHMASENDYDIVLIDIQMPLMDGLEASKEIRARGFTAARLPILAVTGYQTKIEMLHAHGIQDIISKPFTVEEIAGKLAEFLPA